MTLYRVFPDPRLAIDETTEAGLDQLAELYSLQGDQSVRANMIVSPLSSLVGADGTSRSLSSPTDRALLTLLRQLADAVIIGAETLRTEPIPVPAGVPLIILSRSGHIATKNLIRHPSSGDVVVMTHSPDTATDSLGNIPHRIIALDDSPTTAHAIRGQCHQEGWNHLLVEGGQRVFTLFAKSGLVDDLCVTLTGAPRSDDTPPVSWWPKHVEWEMSHLLMDDQRMLYHRYSALR